MNIKYELQCIAKGILFLIGLFLIDGFIGFCCKDMTASGDLQGRLALQDMYNSQEMDMVFLGSSNIYSAVNPDLLEEQLDDSTSVFIAATSSAMPIDSYYYLKELLRTGKKPSTVFIDLFYPGYQNSGFYERPEHSIYLYDYLKPSLNKVAYFMDTFEGSDKLFALFNTRRYIANLNIKNVFSTIWTGFKINMSFLENVPHGNEKREYGGKGYCYLTVSIESGNMGAYAYPEAWDGNNVNEDAVRRLNAICQLCEEEGIEIIFITPPLADTTRIGMQNYEEVHDFFQKIADEIGVEYWDFNYAKNDLIVMEDIDFYDQHHLSQNGAEKFTAAIGRVIEMTVEERGDNFYATYDDVKENYKQIAGVSLGIDSENGMLIAFSIREEGVPVEYTFYKSIDRNDYNLIQRSADNMISLEQAKGYWIKVVAINPELQEQREEFWEIYVGE